MIRCRESAAPLAVAVALVAACAASSKPKAPPSPTANPPAAANPPAPDAAPTRLALVHVTVVDVASGAEQPDRAVILDGDRIVAVTAADAVPTSPPLRRVEARGKWVIPGLWDMHVHLGDPGSTKLFVANGVTGVRVMWGNPDMGSGPNHIHTELRDAIAKGERVGPRMVIASNIFDGPKPIWPNSLGLSTPAEARAAVAAAKKDGADFIKVYSLLPRDVYLAIADESKKEGIPFAGHVPESMSVGEASDAGQKSMEHLYGFFTAVSAHETALRQKSEKFKKPFMSKERIAFAHKQLEEALATWDETKAQALFKKLKDNGTWQTPTLTVLHNMATVEDPAHAQDERLKYVSPFVKAFWNPKEDFRFKDRTAEDYAFARKLFDKQLMLVGKLAAAGVPLLAGTDEMNPYCLPGFSLHDELGLMVKAGLTPLQALRAATLGPAQFFGREATEGTVAEGKVADLVLLDADPLADIANTRKIDMVVARGRLYDRAALDKLLGEVAAAAAGKPASAPATANGLVSDFEAGTTATRFGAGWAPSTDSIAGGKATVTLTPVAAGARGSKGALAIKGTIPAGDIPQAWAGAQLSPGATLFAPTDLSRFKAISFFARGDGKKYSVALFTRRNGFRPTFHEFVAGAGWQRFSVPFSAFDGNDGSDVTAIVFMGGPTPGDVSFSIDDVAFE